MRMVKKALLWIAGIFIGFVVLVIAIGMLAGNSSPPAESAAAASTPAQGSSPPVSVAAKEAPKVVPIKMTARELFAAYETNEVAADEAIKGNVIEVSGVVDSIDKDFMDNIVVHMQTSNQFQRATMKMEDSEKKAAMALRKGQKVTTRCEKMARIMGSPYGSDCTFL